MGTDAMDSDVRAAADQGDLIGAIKLLRQRTGLGLKEAKDSVEAYLHGREGHSASDVGNLPLAAIVALQEGKLIEAIRQTRMATGRGLRDSKEAVEQFLATNPASHEQFQMAARRNHRFPWLALLMLAALVVLALTVLRK